MNNTQKVKPNLNQHSALTLLQVKKLNACPKKWTYFITTVVTVWV